MQNLGQTRSAHRTDHLLLTPDTFVRAPLPGMVDATAIVHVSPAAGARFTQYTAEFEPGGSLGPTPGSTPAQRFVYVLDGTLSVGGHSLAVGDYVYIPAGNQVAVEAPDKARAEVIEKPYLPLPDVAAPEMRFGSESQILPQPLMGDPWL